MRFPDVLCNYARSLYFSANKSFRARSGDRATMKVIIISTRTESLPLAFDLQLKKCLDKCARLKFFYVGADVNARVLASLEFLVFFRQLTENILPKKRFGGKNSQKEILLNV